MIPKIEDGNNFGVSIQEDTLAELRTVESEALAYYDQAARYHVTRAKLISRVGKFPHIEDYRYLQGEYLQLYFKMFIDFF
jgi:proteasome activator subunit 3 (PA28 gamma)